MLPSFFLQSVSGIKARDVLSVINVAPIQGFPLDTPPPIITKKGEALAPKMSGMQ